MNGQRGTLPRATALGATAVLAVMLLAGCTTGGSGGGSSAGSGGGSTALGAPVAAAADSAGRQTAAGKAGSLSQADRSITTTGSLDLTAADPIGAATDIAGIVAGSGGRVENLDEAPAKQASSHLTARIPSSAFDATLASIKRAGRVQNLTLRSTDVTAQVTDYGVRIAGLRSSIARLQALLAKASTTTDLVQIEGTLTNRETDLEQLLAQQKALTDQVAYATLIISIVRPAVVHRVVPTDFLSGLLAGGAALLATLAALAVGLGVALPWLVAVGIVAAVAVAVRRRVRATQRRRKEPTSA
jgi:hypothetical protein